MVESKSESPTDPTVVRSARKSLLVLEEVTKDYWEGAVRLAGKRGNQPLLDVGIWK